MNTLINELIEKGMGQFMDESRDALAESDEIYSSELQAEDEMEEQFDSLDLTQEQKKVVNEYISSALAVNHRYADISYMAGVRDTIRMIVSLGLIKGMEAEDCCDEEDS